MESRFTGPKLMDSLFLSLLAESSEPDDDVAWSAIEGKVELATTNRAVLSIRSMCRSRLSAPIPFEGFLSLS